MISGQFSIGSQKYAWMEMRSGSSGAGNRGLEVNPGRHQLWFSPNPHDNPKYNKKQEQFYAEAAAALEKELAGGKTPFTSGFTVTIFNESYTVKPI